MNFKKYLLLDCIPNPKNAIETYESGYELQRVLIKPKMVTGFLRNEVDQQFNFKTGWKPDPKDKVYFFPGCTVPRFKVRDKFAVTIKPDNATVAFMNKDTLVGSDSTFNHYRDLLPITLTQVLNMMDDYAKPDAAMMIKSLAKNDTVAGFFISREMWFNHSYSRVHMFKSGEDLSHHTGVSRYTHQYKCQANEFQLFGFIKGASINTMKCDIYPQEDMLNVLNDGNIVIDEKKYQELRAFGNTGESENIVLMMELMANADYNKSLVHLIFLMKEFGPSMYGHREMDHVNFKGLLNFLHMQKTDVQYKASLNIHKLTTILKKHKKFTKENAMLISILCSKEHFNESHNDNKYYTTGPVLALEHLNELDEDDTDD